MKRFLNRQVVGLLRWMFVLTIQSFNGSTILAFALLFPLVVRAQFSPAETFSANSTSGQFIVSGGQQVSPLASLPEIVTNTSLVRLEPALLAVSAERIKESLRRQLGISQSAPWSGKIFLALRPAQSSDEDVTIISSRIAGIWNYRVELPDIVSRTRLARALTGVLLLEFANRSAQEHSAEIPAWLTDGLSQQLAADGSPENILSPPDKNVEALAVTRSGPAKIPEGMALARLNHDQHGVDPLADARQVLKNCPALTFEQLSWPDDSQVSGADGGAYRASAQLFVREILGLKTGAADLRAMLQNLPQFYNWQTAFQKSFSDIFPTPLDVEKWWSLRVVDFAAADRGPQWTSAASRDKLDEILSVAVEMRDASNSLPAHAEVSLQAVIRNFDFAQQSPVLDVKMRDLALARFQMASRFVALADAYRSAIQDYLDTEKIYASRPAKAASVSSEKNGADETLKKLDALDAQRWTIEAAIKPEVLNPKNLNASAP
jgi:hypothetical protein